MQVTPHTHSGVPPTVLVVAAPHPELDAFLSEARGHGVVVARTGDAHQAQRWLSTLRPDVVMATEPDWPTVHGGATEAKPAHAPHTQPTQPWAQLTWAGSVTPLRQQLATHVPALGETLPWVAAGALRVDEARGLVGRALPGGRLLQTPVPPIELRLLLCLARHQGRFVTRDELLWQVWPSDAQPQPRTVDQVVRRLRKLLSAVGLSGALRSLRGLGYRLDVA